MKNKYLNDRNKFIEEFGKPFFNKINSFTHYLYDHKDAVNSSLKMTQFKKDFYKNNQEIKDLFKKLINKDEKYKYLDINEEKDFNFIYNECINCFMIDYNKDKIIINDFDSGSD
jgi:hypothetical protein